MTTITEPIVVPEGTVLSKGSHKPNGKYCVMELVSVLAGEPWGDKPTCVASTLRQYCITLNDRMPDDVRQRLLPYVPRLIGTAPESREVAQKRAHLCTDRVVRVFAPLALDACGRTEDAARLRSVAPIVDQGTARDGRRVAYAAYAANSACAAAYYDAYDAYDAARDAACAAVCAAAVDADAAWDEALQLLDDLLAVTA